ncbi:MFS transporter [Dactylosporangium matsuzakiense]|uniref:MFS transporter n=1 Tax=Dactylosporangium matsuzakiense TaxID=53360 RepID=A0A9W6NJC2_9ACTN|nr:MFS transporter [Dactylosporangium matsuzakiense]UWZ44988.1 MFS transporter [Dactylosporangium matsuzakiense]GLK99098.1 MFS transporter [Dactylosporangium matsuzakiense]
MSAATAPPRTQAHFLRAVLRQRGFRRLVAVRVVAQVGDGLFQGALAGSVLFNPEQRAGGMAIAAGFAILLLPYSLVGPYVGVFLDRWQRHSIIIVANIVRALLVVPIAVYVWGGEKSPIPFLLALVAIGLNRFFLAGLSAATPHVVADHTLVTANSLSGTLGSLSYTLGIGVGAALIKTVLATSFHGYALVVGLAALFYLVSALIGRVSFAPDELGPDARDRRGGSILAALRETSRGTVAGVRHLTAKRGAAYLVLAQAMFRLLYGVVLLACLLLFRTGFNHGGDVTGSFGTIANAFLAGGVGMLIASFVTPPVARRIGGWRWVAIVLAGTGLAIVGFGLPFDPVLLLGAVFVTNLAAQGIKIVTDTSLQHECADEYRGRVFSINDTTFNIALVAGMYLGALTLPDTGRSVAVLCVVAAGYVLAAAGYAALGGRWARRVGDDIAGPGRTLPRVR